jgi:hypothetical protein
LTIYTISGVDAATNASTPGTTEVGNPYSVYFNTGNNHDEGYVARWTGINPGADGTFKVRATAHPSSESGYKAYAFSVFELQSAETITQLGVQRAKSQFRQYVDYHSNAGQQRSGCNTWLVANRFNSRKGNRY